LKFTSHHRSRRLAERHRKELERKHGTTFKIERRNRSGYYSTRGRTFYFVETNLIEWLVTVNVHSNDQEGQLSHQRNIDFLVPAPANAADEQVWDILWKLRFTIPKKERWILSVPEEWQEAEYVPTGHAPKYKDRIIVR
jgi:hypothetical protein